MSTDATDGPRGRPWRASPLFVYITVVIGITTELFVYGVVIPLLPFLLKRFPSIINDPSSLQVTVSLLLASEAIVGVVLSPVLGLLLDRYSPRKWPFIFGLLVLIVVSVLKPNMEKHLTERCSQFQSSCQQIHSRLCSLDDVAKVQAVLLFG
jgi:MFS family permease